MEASGRQAAFLGREDGSFEAWVYPLKVLHDFNLAFGVAAYADPIPGASLASSVDVRPETSTVRYAHSVFTVDATWFVPLAENGGLVLLDVATSEPITVVVKFRPDLKPMWPAGLGGQYSYWDNAVKAYVIGEGSGKNSALVGSPLGLEPPEQPAHNLPDAPSQFSIRITPEDAARGLVPIVIAASVNGLEAAKKSYANLLATVEPAYRAAVAHSKKLREELTSIDTPDDRLDLAFEWGKVALDKGFVCNPHLGCGLIAGLGPSGTTERPGFGWYFGGDAFINSWAMTAYGDFENVKASLEFLRKRQRADGKMMHELSQSAGFIRWFEDYPYGYYHADTTPLYIVAIDDYVKASGDTALAKDFWASIRKAYDYCTSTDEDGDGLMDNTKAGLAAVETGTLRRRDVLTDVFLGAAWTEAARAMADLAAIADPPFQDTAMAAAKKARGSLNRRFLDDERRRVFFAVMKDGKGQAEQTVWPGFGIWRRVFDMGHPAIEGMLDELAGPGIASDWGARMLSKDSKLYASLSYNNGAVWPFLTGFAALALYTGDRPDAGWAYLDGTADLTFLEPRGYMPELFSGDRLRSVDAAVPHQLFATQGFMSILLRGLLGVRPADGTTGGVTSALPAIHVAPALPPGWSFLHVRNLRWQQGRFDLRVSNGADGATTVEVMPRSGAVNLMLRVALPPGSEIVGQPKAAGALRPVPDPTPPAPPLAHGPRLVFAGAVQKSETIRIVARRGIELLPIQPPLQLGDVPQRLRPIDTQCLAGACTARLVGLRGRTYQVRLLSGIPIASIDGARQVSAGIIELTIPPGDGQWGEAVVRLKLRK
jgi:glycogen debranching enzyme